MSEPAELTKVTDKIIEETTKLAEQYRDAFIDDPVGELKAWLLIAARREAMVVEVYGTRHRAKRLAGTAGAERAASSVVAEIYQQEAVHKELVSKRLEQGIVALKGKVLGPTMDKLMGAVEGQILVALTSTRPSLGKALARFVTTTGAAVAPGTVPPFANELGALNTREFFRLAAALELTAKQSYRRMVTLLKGIKRDGVEPPSMELEGIIEALTRVHLDEDFHEKAFNHMVTWMTDADIFDAALEHDPCLQQIADLLPRIQTFGAKRNEVYTDGGLGDLFKRHGIDVRVVS